jgi:hypothetical protein
MAKQATTELGLKGKGVAPVKIKELDKLAGIYISNRDARIEALHLEIEAKQILLAALHKHADQITMPDGSLIYHFDESVITVTAGKEKLKVESVFLEPEEEEGRE